MTDSPRPLVTLATLPLPSLDRRDFLRAGLLGLGAALLGRAAPAEACGEPPLRCEPTADNIEGPYYRPGAPMRSELATSGMRGTRFELEGAVHSTRCAPLPGARIEIWQADANGRYDERGFTLRGTLRADANGRFRVRTIVPGHYLNGYQYRPAHLHVKVSAPGHRPLTTQLYFQGDPYNTTDPWIRPSLVLNPERDGRSLRAQRTLYLSPA